MQKSPALGSKSSKPQMSGPRARNAPAVSVGLRDLIGGVWSCLVGPPMHLAPSGAKRSTLEDCIVDLQLAVKGFVWK
jgi:hypothetical protein